MGAGFGEVAVFEVEDAVGVVGVGGVGHGVEVGVVVGGGDVEGGGVQGVDVGVVGAEVAGQEAGEGGGVGQADQGQVFSGVQCQVQVVQVWGQGEVDQFHQGWVGGWGVEGVSVGQPHGVPFWWWCSWLLGSLFSGESSCGVFVLVGWCGSRRGWSVGVVQVSWVVGSAGAGAG